MELWDIFTLLIYVVYRRILIESLNYSLLLALCNRPNSTLAMLRVSLPGALS